MAAFDYAGVRSNGAAGFLCKADSAHGTDPETGRTYAKRIGEIFAAHGFARIDSGTTGGGVPGTSRCRVS